MDEEIAYEREKRLQAENGLKTNTWTLTSIYLLCILSNISVENVFLHNHILHFQQYLHNGYHILYILMLIYVHFKVCSLGEKCYQKFVF